ncbi:transposase [Candidatus Gottesmanbacteria bacterium]|nr:transposase [Candidatus Gottesmanbacteria bacterium]
MPRRRVIFAAGEFYHIYNRSTNKAPIFRGKRECDIFLDAVRFYLQPKPPTKFSIYRKSRQSFKLDLDQNIVTIVNYCVMPSHFHFTLRQERDRGIQQFIQRLSNSFAHYFSVKYKKRGHIFEDKFKAVHVETQEQLVHLSRYIHLNPVTSYIEERPEDYFYSSYNIYTGKIKSDIVDPRPVMENFNTVESYKNFVLSRKDYQRSLEQIKHLIFE